MSACIISPRVVAELDPMDVAEVDDVLFIFASHAYAGETVTETGITVEVLSGSADADAQLMAKGAAKVGRLDGDDAFVPDPSGLVVLQRFEARGRTVGNVYCWRCMVTLSSGRKLSAAAHIAVCKL